MSKAKQQLILLCSIRGLLVKLRRVPLLTIKLTVLSNKCLCFDCVLIARVTVLPPSAVFNKPSGQSKHRQQQNLGNPSLQLIQRRTALARDSSAVFAQLKEEGLLMHDGKVGMDIDPKGTQ